MVGDGVISAPICALWRSGMELFSLVLASFQAALVNLWEVPYLFLGLFQLFSNWLMFSQLLELWWCIFDEIRANSAMQLMIWWALSSFCPPQLRHMIVVTYPTKTYYLFSWYMLPYSLKCPFDNSFLNQFTISWNISSRFYESHESSPHESFPYKSHVYLAHKWRYWSCPLAAAL